MSCTSKHKIREELRDIYAEARDDPPNVNKVWTLVKSRLPNARRRHVREVLKEDEFTCQRREPNFAGNSHGKTGWISVEKFESGFLRTGRHSCAVSCGGRPNDARSEETK
jgi:hypothetical protein